MKRIIASLAVILTLIPIGNAQNLSERVYVSTDRNVYIAGEDMFCSAFCFNLRDHELSDLSNIAYLELISQSGPVQTAKIALKDGRGGGLMNIANTIPTGNYRLVAYTSQCFNEIGYDYEEGSKLISIYNPFTTERGESGVDVVESSSTESAAIPASGKLSIGVDDKVRLTNNGTEAVTLSVALTHDDGFVSPDSENIASFASSVKEGSQFKENNVISFEGEIVRAKLVGEDQNEVGAYEGQKAFLSIPGRKSEVYSAILDQDCNASFYTNNIYGNAEIVLEVPESDNKVHLEIESPFASVKASGLKPLTLSRDMESRILERSVAMQIGKAAQLDTLYDVLPISEDNLLDGEPVVYILDDYTRFPLMEELFIEFISEIKVKKNKGNREIVLFLTDNYAPSTFSVFSPLLLLDGVPVFDHEKIITYDPLLVKSITIYPRVYKFGGWFYGGVVCFETYKNNLPSYTFPESARIVSYQGTSYPVVSYLPSTDKNVPDMRQTLLWHPEVRLEPGESMELDYILPSYDGRFKLVVEGVDEKLQPIYQSTELTRQGR